ncbi:nucleoside monophosphate kinase [Candidatus Woesearchaeota archaeon]|nr:nucleoside monophosphate kinase [Candidatus Woesearchaeota archaeon]
MIITISGAPGSGKTTVAKVIAEKLGYKHHSVGDLRGEIARRYGMTIDELNEVGKKEIWTDKEADDLTKEMGEKQDDFIIDGWVAFHFIPHSIKIFLDVEPLEGAKRVFKHQRPDEAKQDTPEGVLAMLNKRRDETNDRYKKYYNVDFLEKKNYDLVIDTTNLTLDQAIQKVMDFIKSRT